MRIGVIAIQGNIDEHVYALKRALSERKEDAEIIRIKHSGLVKDCDALVIPGGESTTIGNIMKEENIDAEIGDLAEKGAPILGTCAGLILLSKQVEDGVADQPLLNLMDIKTHRNAFGRQRESFEVPLQIPALGEKPFQAVFIRAPAITHAETNVNVLATFNRYIVAARQRNLVALAFHPELTEDTRFHHYFLDML